MEQDNPDIQITQNTINRLFGGNNIPLIITTELLNGNFQNLINQIIPVDIQNNNVDDNDQNGDDQDEDNYGEDDEYNNLNESYDDYLDI